MRHETKREMQNARSKKKIKKSYMILYKGQVLSYIFHFGGRHTYGNGNIFREMTDFLCTLTLVSNTDFVEQGK